MVVTRAQELCESRGGRPGLPVPNKPTVSVDVKQHWWSDRLVSRFGLAVRRYRLVSRATSVRIHFGYPFLFKKLWSADSLVTLSLTINETLKWLTSLLILMHESFWW